MTIPVWVLVAHTAALIAFLLLVRWRVGYVERNIHMRANRIDERIEGLDGAAMCALKALERRCTKLEDDGPRVLQEAAAFAADDLVRRINRDFSEVSLIDQPAHRAITETLGRFVDERVERAVEDLESSASVQIEGIKLDYLGAVERLGDRLAKELHKASDGMDARSQEAITSVRSSYQSWATRMEAWIKRTVDHLNIASNETIRAARTTAQYPMVVTEAATRGQKDGLVEHYAPPSAPGDWEFLGITREDFGDGFFGDVAIWGLRAPLEDEPRARFFQAISEGRWPVTEEDGANAPTLPSLVTPAEPPQ